MNYKLTGYNRALKWSELDTQVIRLRMAVQGQQIVEAVRALEESDKILTEIREKVQDEQEPE